MPTDSRVAVFQYRGGFVDGEIIATIPRGVAGRDLVFEIADVFGSGLLGPGFWISTGARYSIRKEEELYRRFRGMNDVSAYSQRMTRSNIPEVFLILRKILDGLQRKYRRKAEMIYVRVQWDPDGERPPRSGTEQ